ncbi:MAG: branched-chain amino acid ABC transporter permease [Deltaproteobacteria bacterium]|jgi:branched-chain amino acid transport system permease protein|nr:branched-chain amino acid ABC transporter permease [Deltaproteobacteria bacterium]MBT4642921.1 branched-chain amino acid ABC transporter permease [Deltaproteobacteria bacterium]MBT6501788.1 branched-chain amino acid ABC transporter permease [Deltaproteobacteria bacterium]
MSVTNTSPDSDFSIGVSNTEDPTAASSFSEKIAGLSLSGWRRLALFVGLFVALLLPFIFEGFTVFQLTLAGIYAIAILGLNILTGYNGQFSLGHSVFYAIGAYTSAILVEQFAMSSYITIPIAAIVCLAVGFLFGLTVTRLAGLYLALSTFALALATPQILKHKSLEHLTGGVGGLDIFKPDVPAGIPLEPDQWWYFVMLIILIFMLWATHNLVNSRSGRAMKAIRDNPIAARSMGINSTLNKAIAFGISGLYAGVAGALAAIVIEFVAPDSFTFNLAFLFLTGMVIGGIASIPGVIFGALFVLFLPNFAEDISKNLAYAVFGVLLILTVYLMPSGAAGFFRSFLLRLKKELLARSSVERG